MADNEQFSFQDRLHEVRKELDGKIDKKISELAFWSIIGILAVAIGGTYIWLMSMNERITRAETKIDIVQSQVPTQANRR